MKKAFKLATLACLISTTYAHAEFRDHEAHVHGVVQFDVAQDANDLLIEITSPGADILGFEHQPKTDEQKQRLVDVTKLLNTPNSIFTLPTAADCQLIDKKITNTLEGHEGHDHDGHDHAKHEEHDHDGHDHAKHEEHDHDGHDHAKHEEHDHDGHDHAKHEEHDHDGHDHAKHEGHEHDGHDHAKHEEHDHDGHDHAKHEEHDHHGHDHDGHHHHEGSQHAAFNIQYHYQCKDMSKLGRIDTAWFTHFTNTQKVNANILTDTKQTAATLTSSNTRITF